MIALTIPTFIVCGLTAVVVGFAAGLHAHYWLTRKQ